MIDARRDDGAGVHELQCAPTPKRQDSKRVRYLRIAHAPPRRAHSDVQIGVTNPDVCAQFGQKISA
jgi:hypothetical protein